MRRQPAAGILPLYLKLYDEAFPSLRADFEPLIAEVARGLAAEGVRVVRAGISCVEADCRAAVDRLKGEDVDLIVTLHLAYSPSGEALEALAASSLPILLLDTTMDHGFGRDIEPSRIMYNHGIHGVQDLACVLRRTKLPYEIVAGHVTESPAIRRAAEVAKGACAARLLRQAAALRIGDPFPGMGDFSVRDALLEEAFGISVDSIRPDALIGAIERVAEGEIEAEIGEDRRRFAADLPEEVHRRSVRVGLGLRRYLDEGRYTAFSANFMAFSSGDGPLDTVPFLEISKAMERGLGYAGEGDVLTACLVRALNGALGATTFTEIFCPDWKGGSLFISHMGEINPEVSEERPRICEKDFPWTAALNPAVLACAPAPGPAVLVNLAPGPEDAFRLMIAPVTVLGDTTGGALRDAVRGWIRPEVPVERFLELYSRCGGTHHSALVRGARAEAVSAFGKFAGIETVTIAW